MPEGEKTLGVSVAIGGDNLPSPVGIGLTDLPNIGEVSGPVPASLKNIHFRGEKLRDLSL